MAVVGDGDGAPSGFGSGSAAWKERARGVEVVAVGGARTTASCDAATGASAAVGGKRRGRRGGRAGAAGVQARSRLDRGEGEWGREWWGVGVSVPRVRSGGGYGGVGTGRPSRPGGQLVGPRPNWPGGGGVFSFLFFSFVFF